MKSQEENEMSFWGHLEVLRWALIRVAVALVVLVVATFVAMPYIFDKFILGPTSSDFFLYRMYGIYVAADHGNPNAMFQKVISYS